MIPTSDLLDDLRAVADHVARAPSMNDYDTHGTYSTTTLERRFGSWNDAIRAAGFTPREKLSQLILANHAHQP